MPPAVLAVASVEVDGLVGVAVFQVRMPALGEIQNHNIGGISDFHQLGVHSSPNQEQPVLRRSELQENVFFQLSFQPRQVQKPLPNSTLLLESRLNWPLRTYSCWNMWQHLAETSKPSEAGGHTAKLKRE